MGKRVSPPPKRYTETELPKGRIANPPPPGYTIGAEVRRVKFGRPPRKGSAPIGIYQALDTWRRWDYGVAHTAVVVFNGGICLRGSHRGAIYEHRHFGRRLRLFSTTREAMSYMEGEARKARNKVENQLEAEVFDVAVAMAAVARGIKHAGTY